MDPNMSAVNALMSVVVLLLQWGVLDRIKSLTNECREYNRRLSFLEGKVAAQAGEKAA
jgi:hypothetical protein